MGENAPFFPFPPFFPSFERWWFTTASSRRSFPEINAKEEEKEPEVDLVERGVPRRKKGGKEEGEIPSGTMKGALHCMHALKNFPPLPLSTCGGGLIDFEQKIGLRWMMRCGDPPLLLRSV